MSCGASMPATRRLLLILGSTALLLPTAVLAAGGGGGGGGGGGRRKFRRRLRSRPEQGLSRGRRTAPRRRMPKSGPQVSNRAEGRAAERRSELSAWSSAGLRRETEIRRVLLQESDQVRSRTLCGLSVSRDRSFRDGKARRCEGAAHGTRRAESRMRRRMSLGSSRRA